MKTNTWKQDVAERNFREACQDMRRWLDHDPAMLLEMQSTDLAVMAEVAQRLRETVVAIVDDRTARKAIDAQVFQTMERIARIGGRVDVTG